MMSTHRIVLTGASGMLGRAILKQLTHRSDATVVALYRNVSPPKLAPNMEGRIVDFDSSDGIEALLREIQPTIFIHTAATGMQFPRPAPSELTRVNIELPVQLAEAAARIPNCRLVHVSSGLAYTDKGRPLREDDALGTLHPYGASKMEAEKRLQTFARGRDFSLTVLRPFSFTGEGDTGSRLFPSLLSSAAAGRPFEMSGGDQVRDHSSVNDIARGVVAAAFFSLRDASAPRIFNLGSGDTRPLRELVSAVVKELGLKLDIRFGARPYSESEPMFMVADTTRAHNELHWRTKESVAQAVWQLARSSLPSLQLKEPPRHA
jgi:nucleoside-diphosphate-sugar epimerase